MDAAKARAFWQLTRMDRPIGSLLLLWPTMWALFLAADGMPDPKVLVVFVLGVVMMRAAGCVINDFADRNLDGHVKRTKARPLPSGLVTSRRKAEYMTRMYPPTQICIPLLPSLPVFLP